MNNIKLFVIAVLLLLSMGTLTKGVGKWKLTRKDPQKGPNRCYVDQLTFLEKNQFELVFKTIIDSEIMVYTYSGETSQSGEATIVLGDSIAILKDFKTVKDRIDFRFEYGDQLGMFCTRENHPYPHKHLPHNLMGNLQE